jgi:hypothetical protein
MAVSAGLIKIGDNYYDVRVGDVVLIEGCEDYITVTAVLPGVIFWRPDGVATFEGGMCSFVHNIYAWCGRRTQDNS